MLAGVGGAMKPANGAGKDVRVLQDKSPIIEYHRSMRDKVAPTADPVVRRWSRAGGAL